MQSQHRQRSIEWREEAPTRQRPERRCDPFRVKRFNKTWVFYSVGKWQIFPISKKTSRHEGLLLLDPGELKKQMKIYESRKKFNWILIFGMRIFK